MSKLWAMTVTAVAMVTSVPAMAANILPGVTGRAIFTTFYPRVGSGVPQVINEAASFSADFKGTETIYNFKVTFDNPNLTAQNFSTSSFGFLYYGDRSLTVDAYGPNQSNFYLGLNFDAPITGGQISLSTTTPSSISFDLGIARGFYTGQVLSVASTASGSAVPEPATWATMLAGVGMAGGALRRRRSMRVRYAIG